MVAAVVNFDVEQGATFNTGFFYYEPQRDSSGDVILDSDGRPVPDLTAPFDFTGCSARMQIRRKVADVEALVTATSLADPEQGGQRIVLGGGTGRVDIELTDLDTMQLTGKSAVYDLEIEWPIKPGQLRPHVERILKGTFTIDPNTTRVDT